MEAKKAIKEEIQSSGGLKTTLKMPQEPVINLKCPRCGSLDTKFCYYNNYSLSQPRYLCKTCSRYWTQGGTWRHLPAGGAANGWNPKKMKYTLSSSSQRLGIRKVATSVTRLNALKFAPVPATPPRRSVCPPGYSPFIGYNFQFPSVFRGVEEGTPGFRNALQKMGLSLNHHGNLAVAVESLISMNQEIHFKLQQQILATLRRIYGRAFNPSSSMTRILSLGAEESGLCVKVECQIKKPEVSLPREWFFDTDIVPAIAGKSHGNEDGSGSA